MKKLFSLSFTRNWYQALLFYFFYSILFLIVYIFLFLVMLPFDYSFKVLSIGVGAFFIMLYFVVGYFILINKDLNFITFLIYLFVLLLFSIFSPDVFTLMYFTTIKSQEDLNIFHISFKTMFYALIASLFILLFSLIFVFAKSFIYHFFDNYFYNYVDGDLKFILLKTFVEALDYKKEFY